MKTIIFNSLTCFFHLFLINLMIFSSVLCIDDSIESEGNDRFKIEGKVTMTDARNSDWIGVTRVLVDGGDYVGYIRSDGTFVVNDLPSGTYVVEVSHPDYIFESARVDITARGKMRARRVNYLQPSLVKTMSYPLDFKDRQKAKYFQTREQWRITDFLMNPMVLTMVLPLLLIMVLPKLMNAADPEAQKEMQSQMKAFNDKSTVPDISEMLASWFPSTDNKKSKHNKLKKK
ncbi:ER membrane protein complex subunit 7-like [Saccostrea echinata]|uniref:ER membrane protein complex subunit 7-like n=1 Tax=Saccostrea echinata TaxID=191078 RepID=UPI002A81F259|nr:ER membrane protein complex subunit 7-like [Saccostrea echinata]